MFNKTPNDFEESISPMFTGGLDFYELDEDSSFDLNNCEIDEDPYEGCPSYDDYSEDSRP